jgi:catechol 2,3-dioxygenase-like lactoylglutathione lyase family enzyme
MFFMKTARKGLRFTHIGIYAHDIEAMSTFYKTFLEFAETDRGVLVDDTGGSKQIVFLSRDPDEHHQIVMVAGRPKTLAFNPINQISLKADSIETLQDFHRRLQAAPVTDIKPITHGNALSVYFLDPEGNRLELYIDMPWYVSQPCRVIAPIDLPAPELMKWVETHARTLPGFRPRDQWRAEMAELMRSDVD